MFQITFGLFVGLGIYNVVMAIFHLIVHADNEEERLKSRGTILWSIISIFLLLSIWGLINILRNTYALDNVAPSIPQLQVQGGSGSGIWGGGTTCPVTDPNCNN
jgi:hypothetical protein